MSVFREKLVHSMRLQLRGKGLLCLWLALFASSVYAELPQNVQPVSERYRARYEALEKRYDTLLEELDTLYLRQLDQIADAYQAAGNLDGFLKLREEHQRFSDDRTMEPDLFLNRVPDVLRVQRMYWEARNGTRFLSVMQDAVTLTSQYVEGLERVERRLVMEGDVEGAKAVRREGLLTQNQPFYRKSLQQLNRVAAAALRPAAEQAVPEQPEKLPEGVYRAGSEPRRELTEQVLRFTGSKSRSVAHKSHARLYMYVDSEDAQGTRSESSWSTTTVSSGTYTYYPRLFIRPSAHEADFKDCTVVFEYFGQRLGGGGNRPPIRMRAEHIHVPDIPGGEAIMVDGTGVRLYQYRHEYRSRHSTYRSDQSRGHTFFGFIVSVYDKDGELLFQRADHHMLDAEASDTLPKPFDHPDTQRRIFRGMH